MNKMETVKERLVAYLDSIKISKAEFGRKIGVSSAYVTSMRKSIQPDKIEKIKEVFPDLNIQWLLTGEGKMLMGDSPPNTEATPAHMGRRAGIPLVTQYAYGGYLTGYGDPEYMESLPIVDFTPDREMTGNWLAFEVRGDSMNDGSFESYRPGDIVICREVEPYLWKDSRLHYDRRDFVIVCEDGILIKRITSHDVENHLVTIHSLNPEYPDRTLDLIQVRKIFSIVESRQNRAR